jgi:hypothetical protein
VARETWALRKGNARARAKGRALSMLDDEMLLRANRPLSISGILCFIGGHDSHFLKVLSNQPDSLAGVGVL